MLEYLSSLPTQKDLEDILLKIVQSNPTHQTRNKSIFSKRKLYSTFRRELKHKEQIPVGARLFEKTLENLWKTGRVDILIDGIKLKNFGDKSSQGKKWQIVASELSNELKERLLALAISLNSLSNDIRKLKDSGKFSAAQFAKYMEIRHRILSDPFGFYLESKTDSDYFRSEMLNFALKYISNMVPDLEKIEINQEKHYPKFAEIASCLEKIIEKNSKILVLRSVDSKSNIIRIQCREIDNVIRNIKNELKYNLSF